MNVMHPTTDTKRTLIIAVTYTVEMGGGEKWTHGFSVHDSHLYAEKEGFSTPDEMTKYYLELRFERKGKAAILHNGVITTALIMHGYSGCYYNYPLCKYSFGECLN